MVAGNDENHGLRNNNDEAQDEEDRRRRRREEEEEMLLEQLLLEQEVADHQHDHHHQQQQQQQAAAAEEAGGMERRMEGFPPPDDLIDPLVAGGQHQQEVVPGNKQRRFFLSYTQASFLAAVILVVHAMRTREQFFLALVYLASSKWAYVILGNACIALCVSVFRNFTQVFLNGLRLAEAEGLQEFFRWEVTETCLALTMFRMELGVSTGIMFLLLVLNKCLHYVAEQRESHLRMTQDAIVVVDEQQPPGRRKWWSFPWPRLPSQHAKLGTMLCVLQCLDIWAVVECGHKVAASGPSVALFFGFEAAILLVSAISTLLLWQLHVLDGFLHYLHDHFTLPICRRWLHPWKEIRATLVFAVEVQAQAAKFLFYVTFFAIVLTYYGLPINLFREVYLSFTVLKQRLVAFGKYRQLMASMDRYANPTTEDLVAADTCIICRDSMLMADGKKLPCGHVFHKSCLREWLVQNQICPICRSDITVMEARQRQLQQAEQRQLLQQQEEERQRQAEEVFAQPREEEKEPEEVSPGEAASQSAVRQGLVSGIGDDTPPLAKERNVELQTEMSVFPAIYKVVSENGAPVWADDSDNKNLPCVVRTVSCGMLLFCQKMQWRTVIDPCDGESVSCMMLRIPDGWVRDNHVDRLIQIRLPKKMETPSITNLAVASRG